MANTSIKSVKPTDSRAMASAIGGRIYALRIAKDWSQGELAARCGWKKKSAQARIAQYEAGRRTPDHQDVRTIANVFGVSPLHIYGDKIAIEPRVLPILNWNEIAEMKKKLNGTINVLWPVKLGPNAYVLPMLDDSAAPRFVKNSYLFVDPDVKHRHGDVVVMSHNNAQPIVCDIFKKNQKWFFKKLDGSGDILPQDKNTTHIYGVVISKADNYR